MYCTKNFKTKRALRDAVAAGEHLSVWQKNDIFGHPAAAPSYTGHAFVEGPHYPEPHRWYAQVQLVDGKIVSVK